MRNLTRVIGVASAAALMSVTMTAQQANMAHAHIGHVADSFKDTPSQQGLLPTAMAEAKVAATHAALAAKNTTDLAAMKLHAGHVLHAIDPTLAEGKGPGAGYGLKKAAAAATAHIEMAGKVEGVSANVKTHTGHVVASLANVTKRADEIVGLAQKIRSATTAEAAAPLIAQMNTVASQLVAGMDANKDGKVSWETGEGGLEQAQMHLQLMKKGEGLP